MRRRRRDGKQLRAGKSERDVGLMQVIADLPEIAGPVANVAEHPAGQIPRPARRSPDGVVYAALLPWQRLRHALRERNPDGQETFLCVHGEPTWGYLYRNIIPRLARYGRVVVPDHMGFGKSETPQDRAYTIEEHCDNLDRLMLDLDLTNLTLVIQDWGEAIGGAIAYRHPERVKRLCVMNAIVGGRVPDCAGSFGLPPWLQWISGPAFEPTIKNLSATALSVMKRVGFESTAQVDETWIRDYAAPFPTPESCIAAYRFPQCINDR